jgi:rhodanese-related sulfurtransferase
MKQMEQFPQDQPIVLYCASGGRSAKAMKMLNNEGWKEVYNLLGGYGKYVPD